MVRHILALLLLFGSILASAGDNPATNAAAKQFRQHLEKADQNKDGFVTQEELVSEITKETGGDSAVADQIVSAMMKDLDVDHDGKLSATEIDAGASKAGEHAATETDVNRARRVMGALTDYKQKHGDKLPGNLEELRKLDLIPAIALQCIVVSGDEKPWGYEPRDENTTDQEAVILFSPGRVDSQGTYILGLADGKVIWMHESELELEKVPRLKMNVNLGETPTPGK